jgi:phospholipid N-methyltransferase
MSTKEKWVKFWDSRAKHSDNKVANGRGSYPNDVYESIPLDIIKTLNVDSNSKILDVGGGNGHFLKTIYNNCSPLDVCLVDSSITHINSFNQWVSFNQIPNASSYNLLLPSPFKKDKTYNKIICGGTVLNYLGSLTEIYESIYNMFSILEPQGNLLIFHHHSLPQNDLTIFNFDIIKEWGNKIGFSYIERVKIGLYHGNGCCGSNEISVLLTK